jgi:serine/threonine protein kinase/serine/threonine protein phosphatase PrpC
VYCYHSFRHYSNNTTAVTIKDSGKTSGKKTVASQAKNKKLNVVFGGYSSAGVKPENQDAFGALQPKGDARHLKGIVACIADGVSCSENAQQASQMAVSQFIDDYYSTPDTWQVRTAASKILSALNTWLFHHGENTLARHNGFVTTFTSIVIKSTTAHIFHVGDSRLYRYRPGAKRLVCLTRDHAQKNSERSLLTRALGIDSRLDIDYKQEDVECGDIYVMTTDGVHEFLSPAEIRQAIEADNDIEQVAKTIVEHAQKSGSDDNVSCLLTRVDSLPIASVDEVHRQLTRLTIPPVLKIGMSIDGYEVKRIIHSGTRSHIYLVQHPEHNRTYVLKAPSEHFSDDVQYLEGFVREQWIGLRINHDNVMKTYAPDHSSQFLYLLAEYVEGQTLRQWMYDNPKISLQQMRDIVNGVVTAMRVLERMEMIHRDIKPENIMITREGGVKLIDFGTVKVQGLNEINSPISEEIPVGSVNYIAPEYLLQDVSDFRSDIFSLGVIVYEMLSGALPYKMGHVHRRLPKNTSEWRYQSIREHNKDVPEWIDLAIKKAVNPNITKRYEALSEFVSDLSQPNVNLVETYKKSPLIERNPVIVWQGATLVLLLVVILQFIVNN